MEQFIADNIDAYGPIAVFLLIMLSGFGLALGEDFIIIPAGMFVGQDHLPFWPTAVAAYLGVVMSDTMWFMICYRYGTPLLHRRWFKRLVHPRRLLQVKHQIERRGAWMIVVSRFVPASRTTAITMAGMMHLPMWKFVLATASCALLSTPMQLGVGILISHGIGSRSMAEMIMAVIGVILLLVILMVAYKWWQAHRAREQRAPRARVLWLKRFRAKRPAREQSNLHKPSTKTTSL